MKNWKQLDLFQREAKVLKGLRHPGIPRYLDCFEEESEERGKTFLLVQQLAPGRTLEQMVEDGWRPTEAEVRRIAERVLEILVYLHGLRPAIVHRDLKPENIVIEGGSSGGRVFLVDFGGVQGAVTDKPSSTVIGTYGYMSPEQFRGEAVAESDLYALGGTVLFLLSGGRHPSDFQDGSGLPRTGAVRPACGNPAGGIARAFPGRPLVGGTGSSPSGGLSALSKRRKVTSNERGGGDDDWRGYGEVEPLGVGVGETSSVAAEGDDGGSLFGLVKRRPVGARTSIRREGGTLVVDIPPEGLSGQAASVGAFALMWNGIVIGMTASLLTGGVAALFPALWMSPFLFAGGKLGLETAKRICMWERLEVGMGRWSLNQRWAPLRRTSSSSSSSSKKTRGKTKRSETASEAAQWEADWRSAKTADSEVAGSTHDLVACRSLVKRASDEHGNPVENWSLQLIEGVNRHAFGETLPPEEQIWIAEEVDRHIQACLRVVVGGGTGDN
ncbi:protein kinase domain [Ectocarpus siliculosus]|uniref:non-specific serine/threonine protein kinase n=1 Tax=Ectocarpus siliculosus TaxID=2880 RepID=D7FQZ9_ECTSI|nr:protein kinase domain [Ectocarpus siliculosus]|eukprot:CBJ26153.1 protein kinase domain [Ectocarpus siliculosus]